MPVGGFFNVDAKGANAFKKRLLDTSERLRGEVGEKVRTEFINSAWDVLHQLYTSEKADGDGLGDRGAGAEGRPFWYVDYLGVGSDTGTFGELVVMSDHPYVIGYEFGTREHAINPNHPADFLHFFSLGQEWYLGDDKVLRAHVNPHNKSPALVRTLSELVRYGWHTAIWSILQDLQTPSS